MNTNATTKRRLALIRLDKLGRKRESSFGIYYEHYYGQQYLVATNGAILARFSAKYGANLQGKTLTNTGEPKLQPFPKYKELLPNMSKKETLNVDFTKLLNAAKQEEKKINERIRSLDISAVSTHIFIKIADQYFLVDTIKEVARLAKILGSSTCVVVGNKLFIGSKFHEFILALSVDIARFKKSTNIIITEKYEEESNCDKREKSKIIRNSRNKAVK